MTNLEEPIGLGRDDGEAVSVVMRNGGAMLLPTSLRKITEDQADVVQELQRLARVAIETQHSIGLVLADGRAAGLSWNSLGWSLGMTDRGVQAMHDRLARERELIAQMEAGTD